MSETVFYQEHLNRVSRSFAFCIARLEGPLRDWVSLSYLLCRILDTIEDAPWEEISSQDEAFSAFQKFMNEEPSSEEIQAWAARFPEGTDPGEKILLKESQRCFQNFHSLPPEVKTKIQRPVLNMYRGMRHFLSSRRAHGELRLRSLSEVNQYCFFVAGLVGELLTDLASLRWPSIKADRNTMIDAHHFGLFLQKVNLLKDQAKDEKEGRFLVPSRPELLASLKRDAEGALRYLQSLPVAEKGFRLFCAWSLFLGLASLPWIERSSLMGMILKIPRLMTEALLGRVEKVIDDNQALVRMFRELLPAVPAFPEPKGPFTEISWMAQVYNGTLSSEEYARLGLRPALARS